jgi:ELWxxDGT repeat protein
MHGTPTTAPAEIPNDGGLAQDIRVSYVAAKPYDAGSGTLLVPISVPVAGCELHYIIVTPSGSSLDSTCAPFTSSSFAQWNGRIIGPGGLTYYHGAVTRWTPTDYLGNLIALTSELIPGSSELFFFGHLEGSDQSNLYAWNGTATRLVGQFEPSPLAFIGDRPYLALIPTCDGVACEKNRTMNIYDVGVKPAVKVASATIGWENTYDIPSYPFCVGCSPRMGFEGFRGKLYFSKYGSTGVEIYRWDPKTKKTTLFKNLRAGTKSSFPFEFKAIGSWMYFFADSNGRRGPELWATNGTTVTKLLEGP